MKITAISGSLRPASSNTAIVNAARLVAPAGVDVIVYDGLGSLLHFNPDLDSDGAVLPPPVAELRARIGEADAVLISSPEYAHGVPGTLKNALDWMVSSVEFPGKPVGLINPSVSSVHAHAQLVEILTTMSANFPPGATVRIPILDRSLDANGIAATPALAEAIRAVLRALVAATVAPSI
ncbi:MAG: NAD(P)H-dependent oxidoreductase [Gemmatimonadota bacterium]|nr:NAD(P)H-dependent oxidoreductase [Gemmatimonadota bacterium]